MDRFSDGPILGSIVLSNYRGVSLWTASLTVRNGWATRPKTARFRKATDVTNFNSVSAGSKLLDSQMVGKKSVTKLFRRIDVKAPVFGCVTFT